MPIHAALAAGARLPAAALALLIAVGPAAAQTSSAAQPAATQQPADPPPAAPAAAAEPAPAPIDPLLAEVRRQLGEPARGNVERADRAALAAFYAQRTEPLLWVAANGLTARARHAMAEIAKADDWGLTASAFELPRLAPGETRPEALAAAEIGLGLAVLKYARHARGGRVDPSQISRSWDQKPSLRDPKGVLEAMAAAETPGDYLRALHPKHPQFERLRQALLKARGGASAPEPQAAAPTIGQLPDGPTLKLGVEHPHVALLRQRLGLPLPRGAETIYDLQVQDAVRAFQQQNGIQPTGQLTPRTRSRLNGPAPEAKPALAGTEVQRLLVNMERWRWMPEDMGEFHVWDNVPEFQTRIVKAGQTVHSAKIIVGKPETKTVVFTASMRFVIFGPEWGVPDSIKVKELLPYLRPTGGSGIFGMFGGTDTRVLERHNLRVSHNGRPVDASQVNWDQVDIRRFTFIQPAGQTNVLGAVKFRFPNKHDIYMHDTPQRELFEKQVRTFSHGCIRVQNPGRLAEILLAEDKGWTAEHVRGLMARGGNHEVTLSKLIPVHVTYFTAVAGEDGRISSIGDIYGHDSRMTAALTGRPVAPEPLADDAPLREAKRQAKTYKQTNNDFFSGLFGN